VELEGEASQLRAAPRLSRRAPTRHENRMCRGTRARVTIDQFRYLAGQTFLKEAEDTWPLHAARDGTRPPPGRGRRGRAGQPVSVRALAMIFFCSRELAAAGGPRLSRGVPRPMMIARRLHGKHHKIRRRWMAGERTDGHRVPDLHEQCLEVVGEPEALGVRLRRAAPLAIAVVARY
jgi:hypothetical protein